MSDERSFGSSKDGSPESKDIEIIDEDAEPVRKEMKRPLPIPSGEISRQTVKVTPLVSYMKGEGSDSDSDESDRDEEFDLNVLYKKRAQMIGSSYDSLHSDRVSPASTEDIDSNVEDSLMSDDLRPTSVDSLDQVRLPAEPEGRCSRALQEKIERMLEKKHRGKLSLNEHVQRKKDFRNPSIYEKLVHYCKIDEYGTNYPRNLFNPSSWGPESYYDVLAKAQKEAHDKKEKEKQKRGHVEFIKATKKITTVGSTMTVQPSEDKQKVSKWDTKPVDVPKTIVPISADVPVKKQKPNT